jgi:hypothetical protein
VAVYSLEALIHSHFNESLAGDPGVGNFRSHGSDSTGPFDHDQHPRESDHLNDRKEGWTVTQAEKDGNPFPFPQKCIPDRSLTLRVRYSALNRRAFDGSGSFRSSLPLAPGKWSL